MVIGLMEWEGFMGFLWKYISEVRAPGGDGLFDGCFSLGDFSGNGGFGDGLS